MARSPVHVAYVQPYSNLYGSELSLLETLRTLDRSRFVPHLILVVDGPLMAEARVLGLDVHLMPWLVNAELRRPLAWVLALFRFTRWLRTHRVGLVCLNAEPSQYGAVLFAAARMSGSAFILRNRLILQSDLSASQRFLISRVDLIVAVTRASIESAVDRSRRDFWGRLGPEGIVVVPSARDVSALLRSAYSKPGARAALGIPDGAPIVGMVAAIDPRKRQEIFLRAAASVLEAVPDAWFVVIGGRYSSAPDAVDYERSVRRLAETLPLSGRVVFTGYREDTVALMKDFEVLVLPSEDEALGGVLIEAGVLGVPVVASLVGGIPEIVKDGETGILIPSADPGEFARAIVRLLQDRELSGRLATCARQWTRRFDATVVTALEQECYERALVAYQRRPSFRRYRRFLRAQ